MKKRISLCSIIAVSVCSLLTYSCPVTEPPLYPLPENTPDIPQPAYAGEALPDTSEIFVYFDEVISDFEPEISTVPQIVKDNYPSYEVYFNPVSPQRKLMVSDGAKVDPISLSIRLCAAGCGVYVNDTYPSAPALSSLPRIQWIRYWKRLVNITVPFPTTYEQSHTYTEGTSETNGESFAITLGLSASAWGIGLSAELTETFTHEVTISSESSVTKTFTCDSEDGKIMQFTVWQLVDGYRICNDDGTTFTDTVYEFEHWQDIDNETDQLYMNVVAFDAP